MKKLVLFLLLIFPLVSNAQTIELDKVDEHGDRYIYCSFENLRSFSDKYIFSISLNASHPKDSPEKVFYDIFLRTGANVPLAVPNGGRLLIKLKDDSIIELKTNTDFSDKIGKVQNAGTLVYTYYSITPIFSVTPEQIEQISKGVKKIRLETTTDPIDKEFKKDKIGKTIKVEYELLKQALQQNKSFSDGF